jgi:mannose-6-phosphate isomerase-like protein (cupin superfamily)
MSNPGTTHYTRVAGEGIEMPVAEVMKNVAFYRDLQPDPNAFVDKSDPSKRLPIKYVISTDNRAAPAGIATQHSFHLCFIESKAGNSPVIHAHDYREIFMPLKGTYRIYFNKDPEQFVELGPHDTFSVPPKLWRRVEQQGEPGTPGMIIVIYDGVDDPNTGIFVPQDVIDADRASGVDPYARKAA